MKQILARMSRVAKTRNAETLTESAFWSMIRSSLRGRTIFWKPVQLCKMNSRRKYIGINKKQKFEYQCNCCKQYFKETEVHVDHTIPAGSLRCGDDLKGFVERLFCEVEGFQVLCNTGIGSCHHTKTQSEKKKK